MTAVDATRHGPVAVVFDLGLTGRAFPRHRLCDLPRPREAVRCRAQLARPVAVTERATRAAFEIVPSFDRLDAVEDGLPIHEGAIANWAQELRGGCVRVGRERRWLSRPHGLFHVSDRGNGIYT